MTDVITTQRLVLRRFRRGDAGELVDLLNNLEVARWINNAPHPFTPHNAEDFICNLAVQEYNAWAITKDQRLIGMVSAGDELGYWLGQSFWGQGYATEAARAMTARHFDPDKSELRSSYHLGNKASCKVLSKLGFEPTTRREKKVRATGITVTLQNMVLTRSRWEALQ
ncbi:GNAT family N-acetyltransferase [Ruegeria hyattellae]|uniref:GNAT family N-acetyltransferase n=1 Tax=Ruegeria hyattellae TaxID=3233337 RepID=UPI00355B41FF